MVRSKTVGSNMCLHISSRSVWSSVLRISCNFSWHVREYVFGEAWYRGNFSLITDAPQGRSITLLFTSFGPGDGAALAMSWWSSSK